MKDDFERLVSNPALIIAFRKDGVNEDSGLVLVELTVLVCIKAFPQRVDLAGCKTDGQLADLADGLFQL